MVFHFMDICGNDCVGHLSRKFEPAGGLFSTTRRVLIWIFSPGRSACWGDFYGAIVRLYKNTEPTVSNPIFPIPPYSFMGEIAMLLMPSETTKAAKDQEWAHLISLTAQGDQAALATFYDRTSPQVFGLVLKFSIIARPLKKSPWMSTRRCGVRPIPMTKREGRPGLG